MSTVHVYAKDVRQEKFMTASRLRKALRTRRSNSAVNIEHAIKDIIAKQVVRRRPAVLRLANELQKHKLRLILPEPEDTRCVFKPRYATAVRIAFYIIERLSMNRAPKQLMGNAAWIWSTLSGPMTRADITYAQLINIPTTAMLSRRHRWFADLPSNAHPPLEGHPPSESGAFRNYSHGRTPHAE